MNPEDKQADLHSDDEHDTGFDETGFNNVLKNLEVEDAANDEDFDPDTAEQYESEAEQERKAEAEALREQKREEKAAQTVIQALDMYETGIQMGAHKRFKLSDEEKQSAAQYLAPAVVKYLPEGFDIHTALFGKYKADIMAIIGVYMLGKSTLASVKELRQQDAEAKAEAEKAKRRASVAANDAVQETGAA